MSTTKRNGSTAKPTSNGKKRGGTKASAKPTSPAATKPEPTTKPGADAKPAESSKSGQPSKAKASTETAFTARDLAKEVGLPSASVARRYLRAAKLPKPSKGWVWADKTAAKPAIEAVRKAAKAAMV